MAQKDTIQQPWQVLNQATENAAALVDLSLTTTPYLAYGSTWNTTSIQHAAQNPAKFPSNSVRLPIQTNGIMLAFLIADADNEQATGTLWMQYGSSPAYDLLTFNPIQAGTAICQTNPSTSQTLRHFPFSSGGSTEIKVGDKVTGSTSGQTAIIERVVLMSGSWSGGDAAGVLYITSPSGAFTATETLVLSQITLEFTSGSVEPEVGQIIVGATSAAVGVLTDVLLQSGDWSTGDAKGEFFITLSSGFFLAENINYLTETNIATVSNSSLSNMATITTDVVDFRYADTITVTVDRTGSSGGVKISGAANGVAVVGPIDTRGASRMFFDWDTNAGAGTAGTDGICLWREF